MRGAPALLLLALGAGAARAQRPVSEARIDATFGRAATAMGALGAFWDAGLYARGGVLAGGGAARVAGAWRSAARVEALGRFHLDPLRFARRGAYLGGGLAVQLVDGAAPAYRLVVLAGLEGRPRAGVAPAVEVGLGGGARLGLVLRRARRDRR